MAAQLRVEATTDEHKAALRLRGVLPPLAGAVVTADAPFTHADVCATIPRRGGGCVLYAKDNQPRRRDDRAATSQAAGLGGFSPKGRSDGRADAESAAARREGHGRTRGGRSPRRPG